MTLYYVVQSYFVGVKPKPGAKPNIAPKPGQKPAVPSKPKPPAKQKPKPKLVDDDEFNKEICFPRRMKRTFSVQAPRARWLRMLVM